MFLLVNLGGLLYQVFGLIIFAFCSMGFVISLYDIYLLKKLKKMRMDALNTSLLLVNQALLWIAIEKGGAVRYTLIPPIVDESTGAKHMQAPVLATVALCCCFFFSTLALLNVR